MCVVSNWVNEAQDLMFVTKFEDFPNSLIPTAQDTVHAIAANFNFSSIMKTRVFIWFCTLNNILHLSSTLPGSHLLIRLISFYTLIWRHNAIIQDSINEQLASGEPYRDMSTMSMAVRAGRLAKLQASTGTSGHYRDRAYHQHRVRDRAGNKPP